MSVVLAALVSATSLLPGALPLREKLGQAMGVAHHVLESRAASTKFEELSHQNAAIKDREDYLMELREEMDMQRK